VHGSVTIDAILTGADRVTAVRVSTDVGRTCAECRLPVTSQTRYALAGHQKFVVYRAMWIVAGRAAVAHCIVFEYERPSSFLVTGKACFVAAEQHPAAGGSNVASVHTMTIRTRHFAFKDRMVMLEHELALDLRVTGEAGPRVFHEDIAGLSPPVFYVNATWTVTRLTAFGHSGLGIFLADADRHACVSVKVEIPLFGLVAIRSRAGLGAYILGARNRERHHGRRGFLEHLTGAHAQTETCAKQRHPGFGYDLTGARKHHG